MKFNDIMTDESKIESEIKHANTDNFLKVTLHTFGATQDSTQEITALSQARQPLKDNTVISMRNQKDWTGIILMDSSPSFSMKN